MELHSKQAEENIIGALLSKKIELLDHIKIDYFYHKYNKDIVKAVKDLKSKNIGIDYATVQNQLNNNRTSIPSNLIADIICNTLPSEIRGNIKLLEDLYKRRTTITILHNAIDTLKDTDSNIDSINTTLASQIDRLTIEDNHVDDSTQSIIKRFREYLNRPVSEIDQQYKYGMPALDRLTLGLHKEELTTIAAKSGVGKTAFALQVALNLSANGLKILIFSREMSDIQIYTRFCISSSNIDSYKFRSNSLTTIDRAEIDQLIESFESREIYINTSISTVTGIKKRIRQVKPDIVIIDYLQLLNPEKRENNREREVATISREIKGMTSDFKIPIIQLSQLNDEFGDNRPQGERAMRESKSIYQNSNNVIYIHRPNDVEIEKLRNKGKISIEDYKDIIDQGNDLVEIILDKQRDGLTGSFLQNYIKNKLTFAPIQKKDFYEIKEEPKLKQIKFS